MARGKSLDEEQLTDTNYYILLAMVKPIHGYGIMQKVKEMTKDTFEIGPASLYTSLKKMLNAKLICLCDTEEKDKKVYQITAYGITILKKNLERRRQMVQCGEQMLKEMGE